METIFILLYNFINDLEKERVYVLTMTEENLTCSMAYIFIFLYAKNLFNIKIFTLIMFKMHFFTVIRSEENINKMKNALVMLRIVSYFVFNLLQYF